MIFKLKPSQMINLGWVMIGIVLFPLVIPPLFALYRLAYVFMWKYEFYDDIIVEQTGVFNITKTEMYYYRIKSIKVHQPFFLRLFGLSTLEIVSSDPLNPNMKLRAIPAGDYMADVIRDQVLISRQERGVQETDINIL